MGTLTIRNVDDETHARLRRQAAEHGRSVEAEVRHILTVATGAPPKNLLLTLRDQIGGNGVDIALAPRDDAPRVVDLP